jgi:hypothetical protein
MKPSRPIKMLLVVAVLIATVAVVWALRPFSQPQQPARSPISTIPGSELIDGYKQWTRVNPEPALLPSRLARMCFAPTAKDLELEENNPHKDKFITVYVNDIGKEAMMQMMTPVFPHGSVIIKEKLDRKDSPSPELLTVMTKREPGYNKENGDWEYMVFDGAGQSVLARGKLEYCQSCHSLYKGGDYVSRKYLPKEVYEKLK